jgi:ribosomal protein S25
VNRRNQKNLSDDEDDEDESEGGKENRKQQPRQRIVVSEQEITERIRKKMEYVNIQGVYKVLFGV